MRKLLFLLFVLPISIVCASDNTGYYQYMGSNDTIKSNGGRMFLLRKNCVFFVKGGISDKAKSFKIKPVNGGMSAPFVLKVKKADGVFKKVANVTSRKLSVAEFVDVEEADSLLAIDKHDIQVVPLSPQKGLLFNNTNDTIDIYCDGSFLCTIGAKANTLVNKSKNNDSFNIVVRGKTFLPTVVTMTYTQSYENNYQLIVIVVVLLLVVVCVALIVIFIIKKRKKSQKNEPKKDDYKFIFDKNLFNNDLRKLAKSKSIKDKRPKSLYQQITFPKDKEAADDYADNIENDLYEYYKKVDIHVKNIAKIIKIQLQDSNTVNLPVVFEYNKPKEGKKDWRKFVVDGKKVWVKVISVDNFVQEVKKQEENALATLQILSQNVEGMISQQVVEEKQSENISVEQVKMISDSLKDVCQILQNEQQMLSTAHTAELMNLKQSYEEDKKNALQEQEEKWKSDKVELNKQKKAAEENASKIQNDYTNERNARVRVEGEKRDLEGLLIRKDEESKEYNKRLVFYLSCQSYASKAVELFDTVQKTETLATIMYDNYMRNGKDTDSFCYYMTRINCKFNEAIAQIRNLHSVYEPEIRMLSASGLVPKNGWIDKLLSSESDANKQTTTLQAKLYRDLFEKYCGVAVIMADEYSYLMSNMISDINKSEIKEFEKLSKLLQDNVKSLGYKLIYARPFTSVNQYDNVTNTEYQNINIAKDMIVEVKKMAVLYGTNKYNTEVSVQQ